MFCRVSSNDFIRGKIILILQNVKKQETECENYLDGDKESGKLDLIKKLRKSETTLYSNKSVYGSKLGRGIWCESTYNRETQPWEAADG